MTPVEIKIELLKRGISMGDIARTLGCTRQNVQHVVYGRVKSPHIREAIAVAIDKDIVEMWPDVSQAA
jgi:lambda repressor-like predicted transcriptional regulator